MSERITEAELRAMEAWLAGPPASPTARPEPKRLLAEIRRLRQLIADEVGAIIEFDWCTYRDQDGACPWCDAGTQGDPQHNPDCPRLALEHEAEAIRSEPKLEKRAVDQMAKKQEALTALAKAMKEYGITLEEIGREDIREELKKRDS
jgi:hypothetical protein